MADIDLNTRIAATSGINTTSILGNGTTNGNIIDMLGSESLDFHFLSGDNIGADLQVTIQHDDDAGFATATTVPADFIIGTLPSYLIADSEIDTVKAVGYVGKKRYVRVNVVTINWASTTIISCIAVKGDARKDPA